MPPPVVWTSPRQRATETARLAGLEPDAVREDLVEWDYGAYEGRTTPEIREEVPGWTVWTHPSPGGETGAEVAARLDRVLADADRVLADRDLVLIGHGHAGRVLIARYLGPGRRRPGVGFAFDAASVTVLGHERGVPRIDLLNAPGGLVEPPPPPADRYSGTPAHSRAGREIRRRQHRRGEQEHRHAPVGAARGHRGVEGAAEGEQLDDERRTARPRAAPRSSATPATATPDRRAAPGSPTPRRSGPRRPSAPPRRAPTTPSASTPSAARRTGRGDVTGISLGGGRSVGATASSGEIGDIARPGTPRTDGAPGLR